MGMKIILILILSVMLTGCVSRQQQLKEMAALTVGHFKSKMEIQDDYLDTTAVFSTANGFKHGKGLLKIVWDDNFIRAYVDKKTGATSYQVYNWIKYQGRGWRLYNQANYESMTGPKAKRLTVIARDVNCRGSRYGGCTHTEHVAFNIDEELIKVIADKYKPGMEVGWKYKLKCKAGKDWKDGMLFQEIVALYETVQAYKESKGLN